MMKNKTFAFLLVSCSTLFLSCTSAIEENTPPSSSTGFHNARSERYHISPQSAEAIARNVIAERLNVMNMNDRKVKENKVVSIGIRGTRSSKNKLDVHVINFENNQGFALIATDSLADPIYAFSDTGYIDINDELMQSGFGVYMSALAESRSMPIDSTITPPPPIFREIDDESSIHNLPFVFFQGDWYFHRAEGHTTAYEHFIGTNWHIYPPYNAKFPSPSSPSDVDSGFEGRCSPGYDGISLAQLMVYYKHPNSIRNEVVQWDSLANYPNIQTNNSYGYNLVTSYIRDVSFEMGMSFNNYVYCFSNSAYRNKLLNFGYQCSNVIPFNSIDITHSLSLSKLVIGMGKRVWNNATSNVYIKWIIDGARFVSITDYYYSMTAPYPLVYTTVGSYTIYHCNWGHGENGVGYFASDFNTRGFTHTDLKIIYDITPSN